MNHNVFLLVLVDNLKAHLLIHTDSIISLLHGQRGLRIVLLFEVLNHPFHQLCPDALVLIFVKHRYGKLYSNP